MANDIVTADAKGSLLHLVEMAVTRPDVDVHKLEALLKIQREVLADDAKAEFNRAFIRLSEILPRIKRNGILEYPVNKNNPDGPKRKIASYAKWEDIDEAIRPLLKAEGFALSFSTEPRADGGGIITTAHLRHVAGHSTETSIPVPLDTSGGKNNVQGYGSALSYGKRYTTTAALNLITEGEDDDGKSGGIQYITPDQADEIDGLITETETKPLQFLEFFGVSSVANLTADNYVPAKNMLLSKKGKRK